MCQRVATGVPPGAADSLALLGDSTSVVDLGFGLSRGLGPAAGGFSDAGQHQATTGAARLPVRPALSARVTLNCLGAGCENAPNRQRKKRIVKSQFKPHDNTMAVDQHEGRPSAASLAPQGGHALSSDQTAQAIVTAWHAIDDALTPVIGARGLAALYLRSLHLTAAHPGLATADGPGKLVLTAAPTPAQLQALIACQSPANAAAIGNTFLEVFHALLSSLVGPSLTERLLRAVWPLSPSSLPPQDKWP